MTKVTAIISAYHASGIDLLDRIENLFAQTHKDLEVILVLNDPEDDIRLVIENEMIRHTDALRVLMPKREGIYASWNRAVRVATGQYITNANVDDRLLPNGLEVLSNALDTTSADVVYGESIVTGRIPPAIVTPEEALDLQLRWKPYVDGVLGLRDFKHEDLMRGHCIGNCPMWRASLHRKHGYFDESMQLAADYEWALRLRSRGVSFYYVKETVATFYFGKNATTARLRWQKELNGRAGPDYAGGVQAHP
jgi:GT2 family glycosyltransferase